ncbi:type VII secretion target [Saccharomonospora sp. NB11]|uniref:type VII secretion target n=1 Tax=Saccharomonospora sp. NB11 TaxID=1642298 RepID=UPI0018D0E830|nr:type VII secretion target [Saccharomonospora sp. NB11]
MGFKVEPASITKFGEQIDELKTDAKAAQVYAEDHLQIDGGDARMYATAASAAADASALLTENYERLAKIVETAAIELDKAATMYAETDREKAEQLDSTYPTGE